MVTGKETLTLECRLFFLLMSYLLSFFQLLSPYGIFPYAVVNRMASPTLVPLDLILNSHSLHIPHPGQLSDGRSHVRGRPAQLGGLTFLRTVHSGTERSRQGRSK